MENSDSNGISNEILVKAQKDLADFLDRNNIPPAQKMMLEMQGYLLMVIINDHKKTSAMYPSFKKSQERRAWWEKIEWIVIPIVVAGILAFLSQAVVFWFDIFPKLSLLK